ncbi:hypothetical protein EGH22_06095 [Halomicroarcula sp. F28]|uniref:DUF7827 domain-containing protein n=1 Tax=Haloarcula salinisoli TaxID=2487746 RepID=UPI001C73D8C4|nr:hypothetical protein [Halomicroarcula salinisoli]MBX0285888.1 hypothetical protein [Halomicroarcula salinisoli]
MALHTPSMRLVTVLCCLVAVSMVAGVGSAASQVAIADGPSNETLGDVVEMTVSMPENGTATVVVEGSNVDYYRQLEITDTSGDGQVALAVNTFTSSRGNWSGPVYTVDANDSVTVAGTTGEQWRAGEYDISVYTGPTTEGEPVETTAVTVTEPSYGDVSYSVGPANASSELRTHEDLRQARARGVLGDGPTFVPGDTVVMALRVEGIEGALAAQPGANDTERFTTMLERSDTSLFLEWRYTPMADEPQRSLDRTNIAAVVTDSRNDTYHVVLDSSEAGLVPTADENAEEGSEFRPHFRVAGAYQLSEDPDDNPGFELEEAEAELLTTAEPVADGEAVTISGETTLAPTSKVTVRLVANDTLSSMAGRVGPDGRFNVTLPADAERRADSATLTVLYDGGVIETISDRTALSVPSNQSIADGTLQVPLFWVAEAGYSDTAYVHVVGPDGSVVGRSPELREGKSYNVTISLPISELGPSESLVVVPAEDDTIDPDRVSYDNAFLVDGPPAGVAVDLTTEDVTEASTPNETATEPSATPSDGETAAGLPGTDTRTGTAAGTATTAADGAGFGVPAALVAGLLALVVGTRRRR